MWQQASDLSRWLKRRGLGGSDLTVERITEFAAYRRRRRIKRYYTARSLRPLLEYLRSIGVVPPWEADVARTPIDRLVSEYAVYLARRRGLVASTVRWYTDFARRFISASPVGGDLRWRMLRPAHITGSILRAARRWSVGYCKQQVTALRSLLRYLHVGGHIGRELASCVPAVAGWRLAWLPKALDPQQVRRVFRACEHRSAIGRRDAVILQLMVRLGLRASDVAALTLDDLDFSSPSKHSGMPRTTLPSEPRAHPRRIADAARGRRGR